MTPLAPILLAEDEETDAAMLRIALQKAGLSNPLIVARDGQEAVDYLEGRPPYADRVQHPLPSLLILDIKLPRMTGFEVLSWLATSPEFKSLPAVVLSSSCYDEDIQRAQRLGAREYHVKPLSLDSLALILRQLSDRWLAPQNKADL